MGKGQKSPHCHPHRSGSGTYLEGEVVLVPVSGGSVPEGGPPVWTVLRVWNGTEMHNASGAAANANGEAVGAATYDEDEGFGFEECGTLVECGGGDDEMGSARQGCAFRVWKTAL